MANPTPESIREASGILARLGAVEVAVRELVMAVGTIDRRLDARDIADQLKEAEEAGRRKEREAQGLPPDETSGVHVSPLAPLLRASPGATLATWVAGWSPWQALVGLGFIVGGSTVVLPVTMRILDTVLPVASESVVLPDQGPPLPDYEGPQDDSPVTPRPAL